MTDKIRQAAEPFRTTFETSDMEAAAILVKAIQDAGFKVDERAMRKLLEHPEVSSSVRLDGETHCASESPTPASEEELGEKIVGTLQDYGFLCRRLAEHCSENLLPIISAHVAERVKEAERQAYLKVRQALEGVGDAPISEGVCSNEDQEEGFSDGVCCTLNLAWKRIAELEAKR